MRKCGSPPVSGPGRAEPVSGSMSRSAGHWSHPHDRPCGQGPSPHRGGWRRQENVEWWAWAAWCGQGAVPRGVASGEASGAFRFRVSVIFLEVLQAVVVHQVVTPARGASWAWSAAGVPCASPRDAFGALNLDSADHACGAEFGEIVVVRVSVWFSGGRARGCRSALGGWWVPLRGVSGSGRSAVRAAYAARVCAAPSVVSAPLSAGVGSVAGP